MEKNLIKAALLVWRDCAMDALRQLGRSWIIIPASALAWVVFVLSAGIFGRFGLAGGLITGIIEILLLTLYYGWLAGALKREKCSLRQMIAPDWSLFSDILSVVFLVYLVLLALRFVAQGANSYPLLALAQLIIFFVFNAIPEVVYIHNYQSTSALAYSAKFIRDHCLEWYLPFLLIVLPWLAGSPEYLLRMLAEGSPFLPFLTIIQGVVAWMPEGGHLAGLLLALSVTNWFMLFRGNLFKALESGAIRKKARAG